MQKVAQNNTTRPSLPPAAHGAPSAVEAAMASRVKAASAMLTEARELLPRLLGILALYAKAEGDCDLAFVPSNDPQCAAFMDLGMDLAGALQCVGYELEAAEALVGDTQADHHAGGEPQERARSVRAALMSIVARAGATEIDRAAIEDDARDALALLDVASLPSGTAAEDCSTSAAAE